MREQLIQYVNLLFAGSPEQEEMKQEILQNTLDRYDDLITQGKTPEAAYRLAIGGIGDINEVISFSAPAPAPAAPTASSVEPVIADKDAPNTKKLMGAVAIGMYICSVLPVIILGNLGAGVIGICMMFLLIAAATVLIIMSSDGEKKDDRKDAEQAVPSKRRAIHNTLNTVALVVFFVLSFSTGAWYITWLIFPIMGAVKGIVNACMDLKEVNKE